MLPVDRTAESTLSIRPRPPPGHGVPPASAAKWENISLRNLPEHYPYYWVCDKGLIVCAAVDVMVKMGKQAMKPSPENTLPKAALFFHETASKFCTSLYITVAVAHVYVHELEWNYSAYFSITKHLLTRRAIRPLRYYISNN